MSPRGDEAAELLADIASGDGPSRLKQTAPEPARSTIRYVGRTSGEATADLYQPGEPPRGAVVVVPGLTPYGKDDPRLVAFGQSLARSRFLVLIPEIANTRALRVSAADVAIIADSIEELARVSQAAQSARSGWSRSRSARDRHCSQPGKRLPGGWSGSP
ncbi:MAG TPA: hypothetical protein VHG31_10070 [Stellaceae bacterium]|nr:hypothetical protein [Stellaceae bacterium]